jgi:amino acid efflux transporter
MLSTRSGTALYVGAVLGPGVLLIPALAAEAAGPASVLAWVGLLALSAPLAITFAALGVRHPEAGGTAAYARAAFGSRAGAVTGWWFLSGVLIGAPAVALIGGFYVADLLDAGRGAAIAVAAAMIAAVLAANAAGLGPVKADLSTGELRRASLVAMGAVVRRLGVEAPHVIFGHSHRAGPLPNDDRSEWRAPSGPLLYNAGCWTYEDVFLRRTGASSPYWPGCAVVVEDDGPPRVERLLADVPADELRAAATSAAS